MSKLGLPSGLSSEAFKGKIQLLSPWVLAILASIMAAFLMPRQSPFPYVYEKNQPWGHPPLFAPFDFEVLRPESSVKDELAAVEKEHGRYYILNASMAAAQKNQLSKLMQEQKRISQHDVQYDEFLANSGSYLTYGQQLLDKMYDIGVINANDEQSKDDPGDMVWLANGDVQKRIPFYQILDTKTAINFLSDSLPYSDLRQPEFLLPLLEKTIAPNVRYSDSLTLVAKRKKIAAIVSTGITVRKGEKIISKNELVTDDVQQKLDSLKSRYDAPKGASAILGYFLLALMGLGGFFLWLHLRNSYLWESRNKLLLLPVSLLATLFLISFGAKVGSAVPLLIPLFAMPILIWRLYDREIGIALWGLLILLSAFSLDWGIGWLAVQLAGGAAAILFFPKSTSWSARAVSAALVAGSMALAWLAARLSDHLPVGVKTYDVLLFIAVSALLGLAVYPISNYLQKALQPTEAPTSEVEIFEEE